ncbi:MAG: hypothetical protein EXR55_03205 [Dehalococcoidia bacterium]|nr:hypothetical protein [Dehalococcoidia bacterium]
MARVFQLHISSSVWDEIEKAVKRLFVYPGWGDERLATVLNTNVLEEIERAFEDWAREQSTTPLNAYYLADKPQPRM